MSFYYLETSALVKLYIREPGTERMISLAARSNLNRLAILSLAQVEFRSAIRRRERNQEIPRQVSTELLAAFQRHVETRFITQAVTDFLLDTALSLVDRHSLRAFDAVQLAGYMTFRDSAGTDLPIFVCADQELLSAAEKEGALFIDARS